MGLDIKMTLTLSEETINDIIKEYIINQGYKMEGKISFKIGSRCEGYGMAEQEVVYFEGASVPVSK